MNQPRINTLKIAITATFTALTFLATAIFKVDLPLSHGYFNLGETMIYICALAFGPWIAGFAGGVGSALADVASPYIAFAPWTLIIKGIEGIFVGMIYSGLKSRFSPSTEVSKKQLVFILAVGSAASLLIIVFGSIFYASDLVVWIILAVVMLVVTALSIKLVKVNLLAIVIAIIAGMLVMVPGYLLAGFLMYGEGALSEIPANILQCLVGMYLGVPVFQALYKSRIIESVTLFK